LISHCLANKCLGLALWAQSSSSHYDCRRSSLPIYLQYRCRSPFLLSEAA
jgi:hypothetical protein